MDIFKNKRIVFLAISFVLMLVAGAFFDIFFIKLLARVFEKGGDFVKIASAYFVLALVTNGLRQFFNKQIEVSLTDLRTSKIHSVIRKILSIDFLHTQDPNIMTSASMGFSALSSGDSGLQGAIKKGLVLASSGITLILYLGFLAFYNFKIVLAYIISVVLVSLIAVKQSDALQKNAFEIKRNRRYFDRLCSGLQDPFYHKEVLANNTQYVLRENMINQMKENNILRKKHILSNIKYIAGISISIFLADLVCLLIFSKSSKALISSEVIFLLAIFTYINIYMVQLASNISGFLRNLKAVKAMNSFLSMELTSQAKTQIVDDPKAADIEFVDVSFRYSKESDWVIKNLSFKINACEKIALVGLNGSGKTTLVSLALGLLKPDSGKILIGGNNVDTYTSGQLNSLVSALFQDSEIISGSIVQNISCKSNPSDQDYKKVWDAAKKVGLADKISSIRKGLDSLLLKIEDEDGILFSGGETQKLVFARSLFKDSRILVLDEPTAALDPTSERLLYESYSEIMQQKTGIFISHRLASTKFCDRIMLLVGGKIEEIGTHDELIKMNGMYKKMYIVQQNPFYNWEATYESK